MRTDTLDIQSLPVRAEVRPAERRDWRPLVYIGAGALVGLLGITAANDLLGLWTCIAVALFVVIAIASVASSIVAESGEQEGGDEPLVKR